MNTTQQPAPTTLTNPVLVRMARALEAKDHYVFVKLRGRDAHRVLGGSHDYELSNGVCSCPDYQRRGGPCKHQLLMVSGYAVVRAETDEEYARRTRKAKIDRGRRHIHEDYPGDVFDGDYDRQAAPWKPSLIHPLESDTAVHEEWVRGLAERGDVFPCD